jgi:hypothetical protein
MDLSESRPPALIAKKFLTLVMNLLPADFDLQADDESFLPGGFKSRGKKRAASSQEI